MRRPKMPEPTKCTSGTGNSARVYYQFDLPNCRLGMHNVTTGRQIATAEQPGAVLNIWMGRRINPRRGMRVEPERPISFELYAEAGPDFYADGGLWWEGRRLVDYDGTDHLIPEVAAALRKLGYTIPRDME